MLNAWRLSALVVFALCLGTGPVHAEAPQKNDQITADNLENELKQKNAPLIVDVREPDEYASGHIAGALSIPLRSVPDRLAEIPRDKPVVVYCRSGHRSGLALAFLEQQGYTNVTSLVGGIQSWKTATIKGTCAVKTGC